MDRRKILIITSLFIFTNIFILAYYINSNKDLAGKENDLNFLRRQIMNSNQNPNNFNLYISFYFAILCIKNFKYNLIVKPDHYIYLDELKKYIVLFYKNRSLCKIGFKINPNIDYNFHRILNNKIIQQDDEVYMCGSGENFIEAIIEADYISRAILTKNISIYTNISKELIGKDNHSLGYTEYEAFILEDENYNMIIGKIENKKNQIINEYNIRNPERIDIVSLQRKTLEHFTLMTTNHDIIETFR